MCQDDATPERNEKDLPPRGFLETDKLKKNEKWASFFPLKAYVGLWEKKLPKLKTKHDINSKSICNMSV